MAEPRRNPVLAQADLAQEAGEQYGIPPALLLGLVEVESGGDINAVSSAQAFGLTQFIPSTARSYGVRRGDARSQLFGTAHYLSDLGYAKDPRAALAKYNAGPAAGFAQRAGNYPDKVLAAARKYGGLTPRAGDDAARDVSVGTSGGGLFDDDMRRGAITALLYVVFVAGGLALAGVGAVRLAGARPIDAATRAAS